MYTHLQSVHLYKWFAFPLYGSLTHYRNAANQSLKVTAAAIVAAATAAASTSTNWFCPLHRSSYTLATVRRCCCRVSFSLSLHYAISIECGFTVEYRVVLWCVERLSAVRFCFCIHFHYYYCCNGLCHYDSCHSFWIGRVARARAHLAHKKHLRNYKIASTSVLVGNLNRLVDQR